MKKRGSQNILYYAFAFTMIVLLLIIVMGGYLYRYYRETIYVDFLKSNEEYILNISGRHENDMQIVEDIVYQIGVSENDTTFLLKEEAQKAILLENHLYQYTAVSQFFKMMLYDYCNDDYLYNHYTSVRKDYFYEKGFVLEQTGSEAFRNLVNMRSSAMIVLPEQKVSGYWKSTYISNSEVVIYIKTVPPEYEETLIFVVQDTYYDKILENDEGEKRVNYILYEDQVIVSRGDDELIEKMNTEDVIYALKEDNLTQQQISINGEQYLLTQCQESSGLIYVTIQSMDVFRSKVATGMWGILILVAMCAFLSISFTVLLSRQLTSKVRHMNQLLSSEGESEYNYYDLKNIESGIQMLVETNVRQEQQNLEARKSQFASDFFRGSFANEERVRRAAAEAEIKTGNLYLAALTWGDSETEDDLLFGKYILTAIRKSASVDGYGIRLVGHGQSLFVLFADSQERMENILGEIFQIGKRSTDAFCMAVSAYHTDLTEGSAAYLEADTAYGNVFLRGQTQILRFDELNQTESSDVLPDYYLQNLKLALKNRDKDAVTRAVDDICRRMTKENISLFTFRLIYNEILHVLFAEWKGQDAASLELYNVFTLSQCMSIQDFNDLLADACRVIIEGSSQKEEQGNRGDADMVDEAIRYMQENYASPELTMAALAEQLHISSVTLSVMFKNSVGVRPSDYLMSLRMEKARELLTTTQMRIKEVGLAVGYEDDHVFTRRFKSYTGKTPGQYREEHK